MLTQESLEAYFNAEELEGARKYIEVFHGRFLVSDELGRKDAVLLGLYMISNNRKLGEVTRDDLREFIVNLGVQGDEFSKGLSDLKSSGLGTEINGKVGLAFKGIKRVREMLSAPSAQKPAVVEAVTGAVPSIGAPDSLGDAVTKLLSTEWGTKPRNLAEIVEALETNALYYPKGTIATQLMRMTKAGILRRIKSGGTFAYILAKKSSP